MRDRKGRVYTPAVGPRLRPFLWMILIGFALLGANGFYLSSVTALTWYLGATQQTFFYMLMVALHLLLGFVLIVPFVIFGFAPSGDLMEAAQQDGDPVRPGAPGGRRRRSWSRGWFWCGWEDSRSAIREPARWATGCTCSRRSRRSLSM